MLTGLGSIIGSGWLFGAWRAAQIAGPGAIWAWVIGAAIILADRADLRRTGRDVPRIRRHGALRPLLARLAGRLHRGVGELDRDRLGDLGRSRGLGAVHVVMEVAVGEGPLPSDARRPRRAEHQRPADLRGAGDRLLPAQLLEREAVRPLQHRDHRVQAGDPGAHRRPADRSAASTRRTSASASTASAHATDFAVDPHRGRDRRHRVQLQRFPEPGEPRRRSAQSGQEHSVRDRLLDPAGHGDLRAAAGRRIIGAVPREMLANVGWHGINFSSPFADLAIILGLQWLATLLFIDAVDQPQRHRHDLHRHHRAHDLRHGAQRHAAEDPRPRAPEVGRAAPGDVGEPRGVVPVPVLLPRLGHAGGGDLGGHDHLLPDRPGQRDDAAPHRARPAPSAAPGRPAAAGGRRLRDVHRTAVLGQAGR